jgi:hypothetical protein
VLREGRAKGADRGLKVVGGWCRGVGDPELGAVRLPPFLGGGNVLCRDWPSGFWNIFRVFRVGSDNGEDFQEVLGLQAVPSSGVEFGARGLFV